MEVLSGISKLPRNCSKSRTSERLLATMYYRSTMYYRQRTPSSCDIVLSWPKILGSLLHKSVRFQTKYTDMNSQDRDSTSTGVLRGHL